MVNDVSEACGWSKCMRPPSCHSVPQNCETATGNANITVNTGTRSEPLCQTTGTLLDFDNGPSVAPPGPMGSVPNMLLHVVNDSEMQSVSCAIVSQLSCVSVANLFICGFKLNDPICLNVLLANLVGPHPHNSLSGGESDEQTFWRRAGNDFCPRTFWVINWFCGWLMTFLLSSFITLLGEKSWTDHIIL